jgi:hypothetical protein
VVEQAEAFGWFLAVQVVVIDWIAVEQEVVNH